MAISATNFLWIPSLNLSSQLLSFSNLVVFPPYNRMSLTSLVMSLGGWSTSVQAGDSILRELWLLAYWSRILTILHSITLSNSLHWYDAITLYACHRRTSWSCCPLPWLLLYQQLFIFVMILPPSFHSNYFPFFLFSWCSHSRNLYVKNLNMQLSSSSNLSPRTWNKQVGYSQG